MKRFYCETCKKVKRVRRLPHTTDIYANWQYKSGTVAKLPIGQCDRHSNGGKRNGTQSRRPR